MPRENISRDIVLGAVFSMAAAGGLALASQRGEGIGDKYDNLGRILTRSRGDIISNDATFDSELCIESSGGQGDATPVILCVEVNNIEEIIGSNQRQGVGPEIHITPSLGYINYVDGSSAPVYRNAYDRYFSVVERQGLDNPDTSERYQTLASLCQDEEALKEVVALNAARYAITRGDFDLSIDAIQDSFDGQRMRVVYENPDGNKVSTPQERCPGGKTAQPPLLETELSPDIIEAPEPDLLSPTPVPAPATPDPTTTTTSIFIGA